MGLLVVGGNHSTIDCYVHMEKQKKCSVDCEAKITGGVKSAGSGYISIKEG